MKMIALGLALTLMSGAACAVKVRVIEGVVLANEHGNASGILSVGAKAGDESRNIFYEAEAFDFDRGDWVSVKYKPTSQSDYDGELITIRRIREGG
jgi:hypothetical protein